MGEVYEAWEEDLQRKIAIKVLATDEESDENLIERFKSEGRALARLKHNNVVTMYTLGSHAGQRFMAMEYVEGRSLDDFLSLYPCGLVSVLKLFASMLEGLAAAHDAEIIHRDIKPQNIMVDRSFNVKLLDFGISKMKDMDPNLTATGIVVGTVSYIAPELLRGAKATKQSDVYSMGLVLLYMLQGHAAFTGSDRHKIADKVLHSPLSLSPQAGAVLPMALKSFVFRLINPSPRARFASAREALEALTAISLANLPQDLRVAGFPKAPVVNAQEMRVQCERLGFETVEALFVLSLATHLQLKDPSTDVSQGLTVGRAQFREAVDRYRKAHAAVSSRFRRNGLPVSPRAVVALGVGLIMAVASAGLLLLNKGAKRAPAAVEVNKVTHPAVVAKPLAVLVPPPAREAVEPEIPAVPVPEPVAPPVVQAEVQKLAPPPEIIRPKLRAPRLTAPDDEAVVELSENPLRLEWNPALKGAPAKKFEVTLKSLDQKFARILVVETPYAQFSDIPHGNYVWSVIPVDEHGARGPASVRRAIKLLAPAQAPVPVGAPPAAPAVTPKPAATSLKPVLLPAVVVPMKDQ